MALKRERKEVNGAVRNKQRTRGRLLACIGMILEEETYSGLSITAVFRKSKLNPKLVYLYFKDFEHLVESFVSQRLDLLRAKMESTIKVGSLANQEDVLDIILLQVDELYSDRTLKRLLHWGLVEKRQKFLKTLLRAYSGYLSTLFNYFTAALPLRQRKSMIATLDLLISGTLFLFVHAAEGSQFLTLDVSRSVDRDRLYQTIRRIVCSSDNYALRSNPKRGIVA
ncbi:TetR/AcrR family transcriptional regulator [Sphingobacterium deserti]|uniref:Regulatory protein TetR n=1 Tax=Sphingobacterium deserti TaxID=1229276 RepID=A0A0B8T7C8_9SPHI|nr:TetR/AcrR family transcriptional regulator [Sphingobacterium deserti]KGE14344.1 regulatory protein TetR [Sphingobacterium deserti]